jgi:hypothetical protein
LDIQMLCWFFLALQMDIAVEWISKCLFQGIVADGYRRFLCLHRRALERALFSFCISYGSISCCWMCFVAVGTDSDLFPWISVAGALVDAASRTLLVGVWVGMVMT